MSRLKVPELCSSISRWKNKSDEFQLLTVNPNSLFKFQIWCLFFASHRMMRTQKRVSPAAIVCVKCRNMLSFPATLESEHRKIPWVATQLNAKTSDTVSISCASLHASRRMAKTEHDFRPMASQGWIVSRTFWTGHQKKRKCHQAAQHWKQKNERHNKKLANKIRKNKTSCKQKDTASLKIALQNSCFFPSQPPLSICLRLSKWFQ